MRQGQIVSLTNNLLKMKALRIILIILSVLLVLIIGIYAFYGGFKKIEVRIEEQGGEMVVYEEVTGDYMQTHEVSDKIYYSLLNDDKIETTKGIGIYYDDPGKVAKENLRSEIGCVVENIDSATVAILSEKYNVKTLPVQNYIVTEFPMNGFMSIMIGIMKVYPALDKYGEEHGYGDSPIIEIYDNVNEKTIYRQEIIPLKGAQ